MAGQGTEHKASSQHTQDHNSMGKAPTINPSQDQASLIGNQSSPRDHESQRVSKGGNEKEEPQTDLVDRTGLYSLNSETVPHVPVGIVKGSDRYIHISSHVGRMSSTLSPRARKIRDVEEMKASMWKTLSGQKYVEREVMEQRYVKERVNSAIVHEKTMSELEAFDTYQREKPWTSLQPRQSPRVLKEKPSGKSKSAALGTQEVEPPKEIDENKGEPREPEKEENPERHQKKEPAKKLAFKPKPPPLFSASQMKAIRLQEKKLKPASESEDVSSEEDVEEEEAKKVGSNKAGSKFLKKSQGDLEWNPTDDPTTLDEDELDDDNDYVIVGKGNTRDEILAALNSRTRKQIAESHGHPPPALRDLRKAPRNYKIHQLKLSYELMNDPISQQMKLEPHYADSVTQWKQEAERQVGSHFTEKREAFKKSDTAGKRTMRLDMSAVRSTTDRERHEPGSLTNRNKMDALLSSRYSDKIHSAQQHGRVKLTSIPPILKTPRQARQMSLRRPSTQPKKTRHFANLSDGEQEYESDDNFFANQSFATNKPIFNPRGNMLALDEFSKRMAELEMPKS